MNFSEMYERVRGGKKARRAHWDEDEFVCWMEDFMMHNQPYFPSDKQCPPIWMGCQKRYYYVVEKDDPIAEDWELIKTKDN